MAFQKRPNFPNQRTEHLVRVFAGDEVWRIGLPCVALVLSVCPQRRINKVTTGSFRGPSWTGARGCFRSLWRRHSGGCCLGASRRGTEVKQSLLIVFPPVRGSSPVWVSAFHTCGVQAFPF